jgi:choline dehydrogenase-like flavoprotein
MRCRSHRSDRVSAVVDHKLRAFGYRSLLVCDGAAMPANPGVNPSLTITALAEHAMAQIAPVTAPQSQATELAAIAMIGRIANAAGFRPRVRSA